MKFHKIEKNCVEITGTPYCSRWQRVVHFTMFSTINRQHNVFFHCQRECFLSKCASDSTSLLTYCACYKWITYLLIWFRFSVSGGLFAHFKWFNYIILYQPWASWITSVSWHPGRLCASLCANAYGQINQLPSYNGEWVAAPVVDC
jgi:hypothetical protein